MAVESIKSNDGKTLMISINGRFSSENIVDFTKAYEDNLGSVSQVTVDLNHVESLNSLTVGMIMLLREKAAATGVNVVLSNCAPSLKKTFQAFGVEEFFNFDCS
ncbi:MAG: anti-sigma factor antagonist [Deltaproteobacteria bacterium]|nr:anti-sigma factor antagonist [Deltaproteobacteria bacterium]